MASNIYFKDNKLFKDDEEFVILPGGLKRFEFVNKSSLSIQHGISNLSFFTFARTQKADGSSVLSEYIIPKVVPIGTSTVVVEFDEVLSGEVNIIGGEAFVTNSPSTLEGLIDVETFQGSINIGKIGVVKSGIGSNTIEWKQPGTVVGNTGVKKINLNYFSSDIGSFQEVQHDAFTKNYFPFARTSAGEYVLPDTSNLTASSIAVRFDESIVGGNFFVFGGVSADEFTTLNDTPSTLTGNDGKNVEVNLVGDQVIFGPKYGVLGQTTMGTYINDATSVSIYNAVNAVVTDVFFEVSEQNGTPGTTAVMSVGIDAPEYSSIFGTSLTGLDVLNEKKVRRNSVDFIQSKISGDIKAKVHASAFGGVSQSVLVTLIGYDRRN